MCELFALSCNKPVNVTFSWRGFLAKGKSHKDGWGIAFYPDERSACIIKEPNPSSHSPMASFLRSYDFIKSKIVVSHVRTATRGKNAYRNTHPFVRELFGKEWVFAHNGTISKELPSPKFYEPIGETDSEKAFCFILDRLREIGRNAGTYEKANCIEDIAREFSSYGEFNFLMSDGEHLYAFWSGYLSLYYTVRTPPHNATVRLIDEDFEVELSKIKGEDEVATVIATKKLTDELWIEFPERKLMIFKDGLPCLKKEQIMILRFIRAEPRRVSIREISDGLSIDLEESIANVLELKKMKMLKQDSRDVVPENDPEATFYTDPNLRKVVDKILEHVKF